MIYYDQLYKHTDNGYQKIEREKQYYVCKVRTDGTNKSKIQNIMLNDIDNNENIYLYGDDIYFWTDNRQNNSIYKILLSSGKYKKIYYSDHYIDDLEIINGYIYCTLYSQGSQFREDEKPQYVRINIDNSETTTQDTPFEWYY